MVCWGRGRDRQKEDGGNVVGRMGLGFCLLARDCIGWFDPPLYYLNFDLEFML